MYWKITCYNGTIWKSHFGEPLIDALLNFKKETGLHDMDIKFIENLT